jgi:hypothetical protein
MKPEMRVHAQHALVAIQGCPENKDSFNRVYIAYILGDICTEIWK